MIVPRIAKPTGRSVSAQWLSGLLVAIALCTSSCDDDDPAMPNCSECPPGWNKLDFSPEWVTDIHVDDARLVLSGGVSGVFVQSPPLVGTDEIAGSDFPELLLGALSFGVYRLVAVQDSLYRGFRGPVNHTPVECGGLQSPFSTTNCSNGITPRQLNDMVGLMNGDILLCTSASTYRKPATSTAWAVTSSRVMRRATFSSESLDHIYLAIEGPSSDLFHSSDQGRSWQRRSTSFPDEIGPEDVSCLATTETGDTVYASTSRVLMVSYDQGLTFSFLRNLSTSARIFVEGPPFKRIVAVSDSVFISSDLGISWISKALPGRLIDSVPAALNWHSSVLVVGRLGTDNSEVWWTSIE